MPGPRGRKTPGTVAGAARRGKSKFRGKAPVKAASVKADTIERILETSSRLLASKGLAAFNLNAVAALSAVDLPTLHSHFKDKNAILKTLFERSVEERSAPVLEALKHFADVSDPAPWIKLQLGNLSGMRHANPADVVLRRVVRAIPELFEVEVRSNAVFADAIEKALRARLPQLAPKRAHIAGRAIVEAGAALLDFAATNPKLEKEFSREMVVMIVGYIREILTQPG